MISYLNSISSCPPTHNHFTHLQPPQLKFPPGLFNCIRLSSTERHLKIKNPTPSCTRAVTKIQTLDILMTGQMWPGIWSILWHCLCTISAEACKLTPKNSQTRLSAFSQKMESNITVHRAEIRYLGKHKSLDAKFLQQAEVRKERKAKEMVRSVILCEECRTTVATHVVASWPKRDKKILSSCWGHKPLKAVLPLLAV